MTKYSKPLTPAQLAKIKDNEIDFSDIPELDEAFWARAEVRLPAGKKQITMRLDADMLDWFQAQGRGYQTRMNAILRSFYDSQQR